MRTGTDHPSGPLVLTLDAGGTNWNFAAIQDGKVVGVPIYLPAEPADLTRALAQMVRGFQSLIDQFSHKPVAISFAFPGPADYRRGVIGKLPNLPAFQGSVALGPYLRDHFKLPVWINNDGDLFALGEATYGILPWINKLLASGEGRSGPFRHLIGITLGTGFGAGIVINGKIFDGDTGIGGELWQLRNVLNPLEGVEETLSIRGVRRLYGELLGRKPALSPQPAEIAVLATALEASAEREAARAAWRHFGKVLGETLANLLAMLNCNLVLGGGLSGAYPLFIEAVIEEMEGTFYRPWEGRETPRLVAQVLDLEKEAGQQG
nr:ROK family protein [Calditrichia bacterium]